MWERREPRCSGSQRNWRESLAPTNRRRDARPVARHDDTAEERLELLDLVGRRMLLGQDRIETEQPRVQLRCFGPMVVPPYTSMCRSRLEVIFSRSNTPPRVRNGDVFASNMPVRVRSASTGAPSMPTSGS